MKKALISILALLFIMGICGAAFAAPVNPFVDVQKGHWSYDAVEKLRKAGLVVGYDDGFYRGDKAASRYEMATVIARAMTQWEKADAENRALIDKLALEFATELNNLGVRVGNLEKKVDNVKWTGDIRLRYENSRNDGPYDIQDSSAPKTLFRTRLKATGQINDDWSYVGRFAQEQNLRTSGDDKNFSIDNMYVKGTAGSADLKIGRFDYTPVYGIVADSILDGVQASFGKDLKLTLSYGKDNYMNYYCSTAQNISPNLGSNPGIHNTTYRGAELDYAVSKGTNLKAAYHDYGSVGDHPSIRFWEVGADTKFSDDWKGYASYTKSNAANENKGWIAGIQYKAIDQAKPGTYQLWAHYRNLGGHSTWATTLEGNHKPWWDHNGNKGFEVGASYVLDKNIVWTSSYSDMKTVRENYQTPIKTKFVRTQVNFYF